MQILRSAALLTALLLSGCQYTAEPASVGVFNVYSSYEGKLPGSYLLFVDGAPLNKTLKPSDFNCAAHSYPLQLNEGFSGSVRLTFANLLETVEVVDAPVGREELAARGARAMIIVRGEDVTGRLRVVPGFWSNGIEAEVELAASITVDGREGRLLGLTASGDGNAQGPAGGFCEGGAGALAQAAEAAMKENVLRLGEALTNSERVRTGL
jgi:hypothetical protein